MERASTGVETSVRARLRCGDVPVLLTGDVGGRAPDYNEWTLYGSRASYRIQDWYQLKVGNDDRWDELSVDTRSNGLEQLDALADMLGGRPPPLPTVSDALRVQEIVEAILN